MTASCLHSESTEHDGAKSILLSPSPPAERALSVVGSSWPFFDLTDSAEAASCRPRPESLRKSLYSRYARKPWLYHLDDLLLNCIDRPLRIRDSPLCDHLSFPQEPETSRDSGRPFQAAAKSDDAVTDLQRGLCCRAPFEVGQRDRLSARPAADPSPRRFHRRYTRTDCFVRGESAEPRIQRGADPSRRSHWFQGRGTGDRACVR